MNKSFDKNLCDLLTRFDVSARELSNYSGLSPSAISRYMSGKRTPMPESDQLNKLIDGLYEIAQITGNYDCTYTYLRELLSEPLNSKNNNYNAFLANFNHLINNLNINIKRLANGISFDSSFLYKIKTGSSKPRNVAVFSDAVARYISLNFSDSQSLNSIKSITNTKTPVTSSNVYKIVYEYLTSNEKKPDTQMDKFLKKLDTFDIHEFREQISSELTETDEETKNRVSDIKRKYYFGINEMRRGELDFLIGTNLAQSTEKLFFYTDISIRDIVKDIEFNRQWLNGILPALLNGTKIDVILCLEWPIDELILTLESWIPLFFTGLVTPYYIPIKLATIYNCCLYLSGSHAYFGNTAFNEPSLGLFTLTTYPELLSLYKNRSEALLQKALPIFKIYNEENQKEFLEFLVENANRKADRHNILCAPPLYTLDEELIEDLLKTNNIKGREYKKIKDFCIKQINVLDDILAENNILDEIPYITTEHFNSNPLCLSINEIPIKKPIYYDYNQYSKHIELCVRKARENANYKIVSIPPVYKNIDIHIFKGAFACINKNNYPPAHFVVEQPKIIEVLEHFST